MRSAGRASSGVRTGGRNEKRQQRRGGTPGRCGTCRGRPGWWECNICRAPGNGPVPEGGECAGCQQEAAAATQRLADQWEQEAAARAADWQAAAEFCAERDRAAEETAAQETANAQRAAEERTAQQQAEVEETARIRAQLAAEYPELAAVSGSQPTGPAPF